MTAESARVMDMPVESSVERISVPKLVKAEKEGPNITLVETLKKIQPLMTSVEDESGKIVGYVVAVTTNPQFDITQEALKAIEEKRREIWNDITPEVQTADKLHKDLVARRGKAVAPYDLLKDAIVKGAGAYLKKVKDEEEAEKKRLAEEATKKAEEDALAEAERLEKEGHTEEAEAVIQEPIVVSAPKYVSSIPKADMRKYRTVWKAEVTDKIAFIIFVADMLKKVPELKKQGRHAEAQVYAEYAQALEASTSWLNKKAVAQGKNLCMAGIRAYEA